MWKASLNILLVLHVSLWKSPVPRCTAATCHLRDTQQPGAKGVGATKKRLRAEGNKQALEDLRVIWF